MKMLFNAEEYFAQKQKTFDTNKQNTSQKPASQHNASARQSSSEVVNLYRSIVHSIDADYEPIDTSLIYDDDYINALLQSLEPKYPLLDLIADTMSNHDAFGTLAVSTTGINEYNGFNRHMPVKAVVRIYEYDEQKKAYSISRLFDKLIKVPPEVLESRTYDVFDFDGIDKTAYLKGENVLTPEQFKKEFYQFFEELKDNTRFIISNGAPFVCNSMQQIGIQFHEYSREGKFIDSEMTDGKKIRSLNQSYLTEDYLYYHGQHTVSKSLYALANFLTESKGKGEIIKSIADNNKGIELKLGFIEAFLDDFAEERELPRILPCELKETKQEMKTEPERKEGDSTNTIDVTDDEVIANKRKELEQQIMDIPSKNSSEVVEPVHIGLEKSVDELIKSGSIDSEKILDKNSGTDINRLFKYFAKHDGIEGFTILQATTTSELTGCQPLDVCAVVFSITDKGAQSIEMYNKMIAVGQKSIDKELALDPDFFIKRHINQSDYVNNALSKDKALEELSVFFENYDIKKYPLISDDKTDEGFEVSQTQKSLSTIGNLEEFEAPSLCKNQILREYAYLSTKQKNEYRKNVIIQVPDKFNGDISIENIAKTEKVNGLNAKTNAMFTAYLLIKIASQEKGLHPEVFLDQGEIKTETENSKPAEENPARQDKEAPENLSRHSRNMNFEHRRRLRNEIHKDDEEIKTNNEPEPVKVEESEPDKTESASDEKIVIVQNDNIEKVDEKEIQEELDNFGDLSFMREAYEDFDEIADEVTDGSDLLPIENLFDDNTDLFQKKQPEDNEQQTVDEFSDIEQAFTEQQTIDGFSDVEQAFTEQQTIDEFSDIEQVFNEQQTADEFSDVEQAFTEQQTADEFSDIERVFNEQQTIDEFSGIEQVFDEQQTADEFSDVEQAFTEQQTTDEFSDVEQAFESSSQENDIPIPDIPDFIDNSKLYDEKADENCVTANKINESSEPDKPDSSVTAQNETVTVNAKVFETMALLVQTVVEQNKVIKQQGNQFRNTVARILDHQLTFIEERERERNNENSLVPVLSSANEMNDSVGNYLQKIRDEINMISEIIDNPSVNESLEKANENLEKGIAFLYELSEEERDRSKEKNDSN